MRINPRDINRIKPSDKKKVCELLPSVLLAECANTLVIRDSNSKLFLLSTKHKSLRDLNRVNFIELSVNDFIGKTSLIDLEIYVRELAMDQSIIYTLNTTLS